MIRRAPWLFDVDGTLVGSIRSDVLRPGTAALLAALSARAVPCLLWSAGGSEYARRKALEHGLDQWFAGYFAKLERDPAGCYRIDHIDVTDRIGLFVDDMPADLPAGSRIAAVPQFMGGNVGDQALLSILAEIDRLVDV